MRPVELIVSNVLHEIAERAVKVPKPLLDAASPGVIEEAVAREVLCRIAHDGRLDLVLKAIAAAGSPSDAGEIAARFKAVQEMHAPERK